MDNVGNVWAMWAGCLLACTSTPSSVDRFLLKAFAELTRKKYTVSGLQSVVGRNCVVVMVFFFFLFEPGCIVFDFFSCGSDHLQTAIAMHSLLFYVSMTVLLEKCVAVINPFISFIWASKKQMPMFCTTILGNEKTWTMTHIFRFYYVADIMSSLLGKTERAV